MMAPAWIDPAKQVRAVFATHLEKELEHRPLQMLISELEDRILDAGEIGRTFEERRALRLEDRPIEAYPERLRPHAAGEVQDEYLRSLWALYRGAKALLTDPSHQEGIWRTLEEHTGLRRGAFIAVRGTDGIERFRLDDVSLVVGGGDMPGERRASLRLEGAGYTESGALCQRRLFTCHDLEDLETLRGAPGVSMPATSKAPVPADMANAELLAECDLVFGSRFEEAELAAALAPLYRDIKGYLQTPLALDEIDRALVERFGVIDVRLELHADGRLGFVFRPVAANQPETGYQCEFAVFRDFGRICGDLSEPPSYDERYTRLCALLCELAVRAVNGITEAIAELAVVAWQASSVFVTKSRHHLPAVGLAHRSTGLPALPIEQLTGLSAKSLKNEVPHLSWAAAVRGRSAVERLEAQVRWVQAILTAGGHLAAPPKAWLPTAVSFYQSLDVHLDSSMPACVPLEGAMVPSP